MAEESLIKKVQPYSKEAEQSVIGAMLLDKDAVETAIDLLEPGDFYINQYSLMFDAMQRLYHEGRPADPITVSDKLKEMDISAEICGLEAIREVIDAVPTSAHVKYYANIVLDKSMARKLIKFSDDISGRCYIGNEPIKAIMEDASQRIYKLSEHSGHEEIEDIHKVVYRTLKTIEEASKTRGRITGIATGFTFLDYKLAGLHKSELIIVAARPAMGKTAFVLNIAQFVALHSHIPTIIFSLEMSKEQLINRILSMDSRIEAEKIRTGTLKDMEWANLVESARRTGESALMIDDTPSISVGEIRSKCRKLKAEKGLGLIIIDYMQLMSASGRTESRQQEISEISRSLKALARDVDCPVIALSQLSRAVEARNDKKPQLSDLRESGSIEQDADVVMFIHRDDYYTKEQSEHPGEATIIVAKQRSGATGDVTLGWQAQYTKFVNIEPKKEEHQ